MSLPLFQPDITWLGGITEARKVVALAAAYNIMIIPHGSSVYSYHLQYAFTNCPLAEYWKVIRVDNAYNQIQARPDYYK